MLEVVFAVAFSAAPLTLYVPPVRSLSLFVQAMDFFMGEIGLSIAALHSRFQLAYARLARRHQRWQWSRSGSSAAAANTRP